VVAGYRLEEQIGRGGMAVVYRARDVQLGRNVALKLLAPVLALDDAFRQRFIRESRAAAAVDHPYIIPIFAAGESDGVLFIAMRYAHGGDVRTLLDNVGPLPAGRAAGIITQVALALDAAHLHGLVHRDIKPANMLLDSVPGSGQRDHVYLADFGLSKRSLSVTGLTSIGQFLGTPAYVAPEQVEGRPVDSRADQYALACAAFEILSGAPPYQRDDDLAVMWAHVSMPPPSLSGQRPELPPAIDAVIARAMAKSPADRFPTCIAFALALRQALGADASPPDLVVAEPPTTVSGAPAHDVGDAGEPPGAPGPAPHPATEISWPRGRNPADPAPAGRKPPAAADGEFPATTDWGAAAAGSAPQHFGQPAGPGRTDRPERAAPGSAGSGSAGPGSAGPGSGSGLPGAGPEPGSDAEEPPTADGWLPPLRGSGWVPAGSGTPGRDRGAPSRPEYRGGMPPPGPGPRGGMPPAPGQRGGAPPPPGEPGGPRKRSFWWPRGAVIIGCAAAAGIAIGAVIGLGGGDKGSPGTGAGGTATALTVPGCSTSVASAAALPSVRSARLDVASHPFGVVTTADGAFSFVTMNNSVAVLSNGSQLAPVLTHVLPAPGSNGSERLTHDGRYLLVAANSGAIVMNVASAEAGNAAVVGTLTSQFGDGAVEVAVSPDDKFAFVTLENSAALVVFNLQSALINGFGPSDVVGEIPLGEQPVGMAISPDYRWLYAASRLRQNAPDPSEGTISVIDLARAETAPSAAAIVSTVTAGCSPVRIITSPDGSQVWVTSRDSDTLLGFSATAMRSNPAHALIARVGVGSSPIGLAMVRDGSRILVADSDFNGTGSGGTSVSVVSTSAAVAGARPARPDQHRRAAPRVQRGPGREDRAGDEQQLWPGPGHRPQHAALRLTAPGRGAAGPGPHRGSRW
jgi:DNA-binding beta-propeller fold protein YncE